MSIQCNAELFPETLEALVDPVVFEGEHRCKFGHATVVVKLLPSWSSDTGLWTVGWFCLVDRSVDEWMPGQRTHAGWPWYRPAQQPCSRSYDIACAVAARAAKIVLEQMLEFTGSEDVNTSVRQLQDRIEKQAMQWLQPEAYGENRT
ncbi:hypothetical protein HKW97_23730 (plasmid) [Pseudomonas luteola]|uniref:hypothetical protein n=1 Tax=Pseudomonas luteola TaxID=47886 RepID=UPI00388E0215